jgi:hypothetical protein
LRPHITAPAVREALHHALDQQQVAPVHVEGQVAQLPHEHRVLLLREQEARQRHGEHLQHQRLPQVAGGLVVFKDFLEDL